MMNHLDARDVLMHKIYKTFFSSQFSLVLCVSALTFVGNYLDVTLVKHFTQRWLYFTYICEKLQK